MAEQDRPEDTLGETKSDKNSDRSGPASETRSEYDDGMMRMFDDMMRLYRRQERGGGDASDAITQNLVTIMGSIPAYAVGETMISQSAAQGRMLNNAVDQQQKTNIISMVSTVGCVAQLLNMNPGKLAYEVAEEELHEERREDDKAYGRDRSVS